MPPKDVPKLETFVKTDDGRVINMADIKTINITDEKLSEYIFTLSTSGYQDSDGLVTITGRCTGEKIVRCRNCKHAHPFVSINGTVNEYACKRLYNSVVTIMPKNGFCSYGKEGG